MSALLFTSIAVLVYIYVGYPAVLGFLAAVRSKPQRRGSNELPTVTLFIPAYNEARVIAGKIENALALDYPLDKLEIVLVSDASTDGTPEIASRAGGQRLRVYQSPARMGKSALINRFAPDVCKGEVIVFTDANALFVPTAIRHLVRHLADPSIGCVVGNLRYVDQMTGVAKGEGAYFRYESWLKGLESRLGTVVAATGSIYAIRREFVTPFAPDVANDLAHPIFVASAQRKVVFEPAAVAHERATAHPGEEFQRKVRIVTRGMTALARYRRDHRMLSGLWGFCFLSHKLLRWFGWLFLLTAFLSNAALAPKGTAFSVMLAAQVAFYAAALVGGAVGGKRLKTFAFPFYFCMINVAALVAVIRFVRGARLAVWESAPTTR